jgi:hypothetical protein
MSAAQQHVTWALDLRESLSNFHRYHHSKRILYTVLQYTTVIYKRTSRGVVHVRRKDVTVLPPLTLMYKRAISVVSY